MDAQIIALAIAGTGALGVAVWILAKLGKALITIAEALAAADLLAAISTHLAEFELPPIASVQVIAAATAPQGTVQLLCHDLGNTARGLLAWTDTLTEVTAEAWRVPQSDCVHLSVTGLLPGAATVKVYSGLPVTDCGLATDLAPAATTPIPLTILRHAATIQEARA